MEQVIMILALSTSALFCVLILYVEGLIKEARDKKAFQHPVLIPRFSPATMCCPTCSTNFFKYALRSRRRTRILALRCACGTVSQWEFMGQKHIHLMGFSTKRAQRINALKRAI